MALAAVMSSLLVAACGSSEDSAAAATPGVRLVDVRTAADLLAEGDRIVIDVRTPQEFAEGRIEGARMIDIQGASFDQEIRELDPDAAYVVYCRTANRSAGARQLMTELGFRDVVDIEGGIVAWTAEGLPLER